LDLDEQGRLVGIDIDGASRQFALPQIDTTTIPFEAARGPDIRTG